MQNRCINVVIDKITKKKRKCKNKAGYLFCSVHNKWKMGSCCFCFDECNPSSQSCGKCARIISWYGLDYLIRMLY